MKERLIETFDFQPSAWVLTEDKETGRLRVRGRGQYEGIENANKRKYVKGTFAKQKAKKEIQERLQMRSMLGLPFHPKPNEKTELPDVSHIITDFETLPSGEVIVESEILNTPNGKILRTLFEDGVAVGISSRGNGTVNKSTGEVQEDYALETWDFVASPSTYGAFPKPLGSVGESQVREEKIVDSSAIFANAKKFVSSATVSNLTEDKKRALLISILEQEICLLNLNNLNESDCNLVQQLQNNLTNMRKSIETSNTIISENKESRGLLNMNMQTQNANMTVSEALLGQENGTLKAQVTALTEANEDLAKRYDASLRVIGEMKNKYQQLDSVAEGLFNENQVANELIENLVGKLNTLQEGAVTEDVQNHFAEREEKALGLINAAVSRLKLAESWIDKLGKRCVVSEKLIESMMKKTRNSILEASIDETLANESEEVANKLRPILAESKNVQEVQDKYAMFQALVEAKTAKVAPVVAEEKKAPIVEAVSVPAVVAPVATYVKPRSPRNVPMPTQNDKAAALVESANVPVVATPVVPMSRALALSKRINQ